jgi:hypothetical protein
VGSRVLCAGFLGGVAGTPYKQGFWEGWGAREILGRDGRREKGAWITDHGQCLIACFYIGVLLEKKNMKKKINRKYPSQT